MTTISVHNFGDPISEKDQKELFVPFFRSKNTLQNAKGWGLGLPMVRSIVEAHGGTVHVHSAAEKGTTFVVTLPNDSRQASHVAPEAKT